MNRFDSKTIPIKVFEPWLSTDLIHSVIAKSLVAFPLNQFINEVSSFNRPARRNFLLFDLHLFLEHLISDLLPCFALVWPLSHHAFISNDSKCVIIDSKCMVLLAEDLGGHIAGGPARLLGILFLIMPGYTEISNSQISQFIQDDVLRFNISVNDVTLVKVVKCLQ